MAHVTGPTEMKYDSSLSARYTPISNLPSFIRFSYDIEPSITQATTLHALVRVCFICHIHSRPDFNFETQVPAQTAIDIEVAFEAV